MRYPKYWMVGLFLAALFAGNASAQEGWRFMLRQMEHGGEMSIAEAVPDLAASRLVYVGETHDEFSHHLAQLEIIRALHRAGHDIAVGLEMFERREQKALNDWIAGGIDEREFMRAFRRNWGELWPMYRSIFFFCRENSIPMVGLNVPRSVTRKVAREGFEALTEEELGMLPPIACNVSPQYEAFLRRVIGAHGREDAEFERFCEAQLVWDTAMAVHAMDYLEGRPEATMVVLTGTVHAWKPAMPTQVWKLEPETAQRIVLPRIEGRLDEDTVGVDDCDYLILGAEE
ncbi:MAG: ChaN family lipoprotein [Oceanidesulfovibrio sp.]